MHTSGNCKTLGMATTRSTATFFNRVNNRFGFSLFLLYKLPSAWISGVRAGAASEESCTTSVPYRWLSQNPFRSTYFACLAMAAEMSSGILAMGHVYAAPAKVSMLVTGMEGIFLKKAKSKTYFTCNDGTRIRDAIAKTVATGEPVALTVEVTGKSKDATEIARFRITWSFKKASS